MSIWRCGDRGDPEEEPGVYLGLWRREGLNEGLLETDGENTAFE